MASVVMAADDRYLPYVPCTLAQLARFGRASGSVTLIVPAKTSRDLRSGVDTAASRYGIALEVVSAAELDSLYARGLIYDYQYISHHTYSKLILAEVLPHLDQVLYLDVDTLIRAPLDDLLAWKLRHPVGAVAELGRAGLHLFGTVQQPYFNAGVLRMSLERMRHERAWDQAKQLLETRRGLVLQDQDVLNLLFRGRFDNLPLGFNVFDSVTRGSRGLAVLRDPVIVHFAGPVKPWHRSATSPFAREWRRWYSEAVFPADSLTFPAIARDPGVDPKTPPHHSHVQARRTVRGRIASLARVVLPDTARQTTTIAVSKVLDRALCRIEATQAALHPPPQPPQTPPWEVSREVAEASLANGTADHRIDLLISIPGSGADALGDVIQGSRADVHWLSELYLGVPWGLREAELSDRFPWFAAADPELRKDMPPARRRDAQRDFTTTMSKHVVEVTKSVVESRPGRVLIKVFPDQLHPSAFEELLAVLRPRLLILRRDLVFTYVSRLRATRAGTWRHSDLIDVPYALSDREALDYAVRCDTWFDCVARLVEGLRLDSIWLTYAGLFATGEDIPLLESLYPGHPMPMGPDSRRLTASLKVQNHCSDVSAIETIKAMSVFSATTQTHLLRLPGNH